MRLIDADELIVQFRRAIETFLPNDPRRHMNLGDSLKCHGWEQGLMVIQEAPTIQPSPHWIPVTERLPEADGYGHYFLVCLENGVVRINGFSRIHTTRCPDGFYYETEHFTWRQNQNKVVAWMPLPEPFKGVTDGND